MLNPYFKAILNNWFRMALNIYGKWFARIKKTTYFDKIKVNLFR